MTIRKGEDWGTVGPLAQGAPVVDSDRAVGEWLSTHASHSVEVGLVGGDLARTVGARSSPAEVTTGEARTRLPTDVGMVTIDGRSEPFAAHVVLRRRFWLGRIVIAANAAFIGPWNVSPRSHPNDGRLEIIEVELSMGDKWKARSRLPSGTHLPHPGIRIRSVRSAELEVPTGAHAYIDGVRVGRPSQVAVAVEPDALTIVI